MSGRLNMGRILYSSEMLVNTNFKKNLSFSFRYKTLALDIPPQRRTCENRYISHTAWAGAPPKDERQNY